MRRIARELLQIAKDILPRVSLTFPRIDEVESGEYNAIHFDFQRLIDRIRKNEGLEVSLNRTDTEDDMLLEFGCTDHEAIEAIVREIIHLGKKLCKRKKIPEMTIEEK